MNAHRDCDKCCGRVALWLSGEDILRVTGRKDAFGEVENTPDGKPGWICNTCRFEKKEKSDWVIEGPRHIDRHSVISQNHYEVLKQLRIDISRQKILSEKAHNE